MFSTHQYVHRHASTIFLLPALVGRTCRNAAKGRRKVVCTRILRPRREARRLPGVRGTQLARHCQCWTPITIALLLPLSGGSSSPCPAGGFCRSIVALMAAYYTQQRWTGTASSFITTALEQMFPGLRLCLGRGHSLEGARRCDSPQTCFLWYRYGCTNIYRIAGETCQKRHAPQERYGRAVGAQTQVLPRTV